MEESYREAVVLLIIMLEEEGEDMQEHPLNLLYRQDKY